MNPTLEDIQLTDPSTGATARVLAGFGFNCYQFQTVHQGQPVDVLWSAGDFASGKARPSGSGIPILFPFPGRIRGTKFTWQGREYALEEGDGRGNAIHGFVLNRPWRVIDQSPWRVVGQFQASRDDASLLDRWPADFRIQVSYALAGNSLVSEILMENPSDAPLPCGLGTHPYFRVPLGGGSADRCVVRVPVTDRWELEAMVPTGNLNPLSDKDNLKAGLPFAQTSFDDIFTGLEFCGGRATASIADPTSGRTMVMNFSGAFRHAVVYNPGHREAICIEPYTCLPDPIAMARQGVDGGLRVLGPGESLRAEITIRVD